MTRHLSRAIPGDRMQNRRREIILFVRFASNECLSARRQEEKVEKQQMEWENRRNVVKSGKRKRKSTTSPRKTRTPIFHLKRGKKWRKKELKCPRKVSCPFNPHSPTIPATNSDRMNRNVRTVRSRYTYTLYTRLLKWPKSAETRPFGIRSSVYSGCRGCKRVKPLVSRNYGSTRLHLMSRACVLGVKLLRRKV